MNIDGSSIGTSGIARGGCIIKNEHGEWIVGFSRNIDIASGSVAELWTLRGGLNLCRNLILLFVDLEIDVKAIIDLLANISYSNNVVVRF